MKNWQKILIVMVVFGALGAWAGYTFFYNKAHTDFEKAEADFSLTAESLYNEFKNDADASAAKYNGKVLEITGKMTTIEKSDSLVIAVFAFEEGMFGSEGVRVTMLPNHGRVMLDSSPTGNIKLKGFCSGYNDTDVIIESGSIVE